MRAAWRTLVAAALCSFIAGCDRGETERGAATESVVRLDIRVSDASGVREATMDCSNGGDPSSSGFISNDLYLYAACETAMTNDYAWEFFREGQFPDSLTRDCADLAEGAEYDGARAVFVGEFSGDPVRAELHVSNSCEQAMWRYLLPLTEPRKQPVIVLGDEVKLSEE